MAEPVKFRVLLTDTDMKILRLVIDSMLERAKEDPNYDTEKLVNFRRRLMQAVVAADVLE
jgi:hypothetical protein